MTTKTKYQNSVCRPGHLHKFRPVCQTAEGNVERCEKCGLQKHFKAGDGIGYLSWHIRDVLRKDDPMFFREFGEVE